MSNTVTPSMKNDTDHALDQAEVGALSRDTRPPQGFDVEWDANAKVSPMGSLVFFAQFLQAGGLMDRLCTNTPLQYQSNNAPKERDVLGTLVLSILNGHCRYAHINQLRGEQVGAEILGVSTIVSEDSIRRSLKRSTPNEWDRWLRVQERAVYEPLLTEDYVLDIDSTVKQLYGHQEGAEKGYNPTKPGRPSHSYHAYFIGALRIVLGVDVISGKKNAGKHSLPELWRIIDGLSTNSRPRLLRGDVSYGTENIMLEAEKRDLKYLFKIRQTKKVRMQIKALEYEPEAWSEAGDGWQGAERSLKLSGWSSSRRCVFLRRPAKKNSSRKERRVNAEAEFDFVNQLTNGVLYDYIVLISNDSLPIVALAQLYRDRGDCENVFDEIKNQWGWGGFVTSDLHRCRVIARLIALVYNWWNIFARLARPEKHMEAITSRPLLLHAVGRLVSTGRRKIVRLTSTHSESDKIREVLSRIRDFLSTLMGTAEQLSSETIWAVILSAAFMKWLRGKLLDPVMAGNQTLLRLVS